MLTRTLLLLCLISAFFANADAQKNRRITDENDRILSFHSDITVEKDGKILVTETIQIYNGDGRTLKGGPPTYNNQIQRGITRDFPTRYSTSAGFISKVPFHVIEVLKNGDPEPYHTESLTNGIRMYIGRSNLILERGEYTYQIRYETGNQIIFHQDKDELYWNVNGTGWAFTSDTVSCTIHFPEGASILENYCYSGYQGSADTLCSNEPLDQQSVRFSTIARLEAYQGLTVATSILKGVLTAPTQKEKITGFLKSNALLPFQALAILLLFVFLFIAWYRHGRDPEKGVIAPQFVPPKDMSPADVGFLLKQKFKSRFFAAALVDYAVRGMVKIKVEKEGTLIKSSSYQFLKPEKGKETRDNMLFKWYGFDISKLYGLTASRGSYNSTIASAHNALKSKLKVRLMKEKGTKNSWKSLFSLNQKPVGFGILFLFITGLVSIFWLMSVSASIFIVSTVAYVLAGIIILIVFARLMPAYTPEGRRLLDETLGFKMYLEAAEEDRLDLLNPPEHSLQLFEKYLPYAIALGCENQWSEKFGTILEAAIQGGYSPAYFHAGQGIVFNSQSFSSGISSGLSSTVASASTPPSSSGGGSSGGGFSGGGGGGGGGGGW